MAQYQGPSAQWHGVEFSHSDGTWHVKFKRPGTEEEVDVGVFEDEVDAAMAYDREVMKLWDNEGVVPAALNFFSEDQKAKWPHLPPLIINYVVEINEDVISTSLTEEGSSSSDESTSSKSSQDDKTNQSGTGKRRAPSRVAGSVRRKTATRRRSAPARIKASTGKALSDSEDGRDRMKSKVGIKESVVSPLRQKDKKQHTSKRSRVSSGSCTTNGTRSTREQQRLFIQTVRLGLVQLFASYPTEPPAEGSQAPYSKEELWDAFDALRWPSHDVENCLCSKLGESAVDYQDSEAFCKLALQVATDTPALLRDRKER